MVTILAILSAGAGLAVGARDSGVRSDADRLLALDAGLRDRALFDRRAAGFRVTATGIVPLAADAATWAGTAPEIVFDAPPRWQAPALVAYLPDGRNTPFRVTFADGTACLSDGWTAPDCAAP